MSFVLFLLLAVAVAGVLTATVIKDRGTRLKIFGGVFLLFLIGGMLAKQEMAVSIALFVACFFCPYSTVIWFQQKKQRLQEKRAKNNGESKQ